MQAVFSGADTTTVTMTGKEITIEEYFQLVRSCPWDDESTYGNVGGGHLNAWEGKQVPRPTIPSLAVSLEFDKCYTACHADWQVQHYGSQLLKVPGQAHCFTEPGASKDFFEPLAAWLEAL
jgi:hypothetical protein